MSGCATRTRGCGPCRWPATCRSTCAPATAIESRNHQLAKLVNDGRSMSNSRPAFYFTLTVRGGAVHHIQEDKTFNAC